jgi:hypothetical protein
MYMPVVGEEDDDLLDFLDSDNGQRFVRDIAFSRIERGSISAELLDLVVSEEGSTLEDEKEVFNSLRDRSRDRLE